MSKPRNRTVFQVETLEGKSAPSSLGLPAFTHNAFNQVVSGINKAAGTYAKTQNPFQFDASLASLSFKVPYGHSQLYPTWQADESIYSGVKDGSGVMMVNQIKSDLVSYVRYGVSSGLFVFK